MITCHLLPVGYKSVEMIVVYRYMVVVMNKGRVAKNATHIR